jgi:hypothetical protein
MKMARAFIGAAALIASLAASAQAPWYPGKWGPNDEIGAANYLTPGVALNAARLVKTGASAKFVRAAISSSTSGRSTRGSRAATVARNWSNEGGSSSWSKGVRISSSLPSTVSNRTAGLLGSRCATSR